jgi:Domain of unknown function (DUF4920)
MTTKMKRWLLGLPLLVLVAACESGGAGVPPPVPRDVSSGAPASAGARPNTAAPAAATPAGAGAAHGTQAFGAAFEPGPEVGLATLLGNPTAYADKTVITEGRVQRACSRKGCWMEIGEGSGACRVTFKDYGFFVPTDSAGAQARIQGRLDARVIDAAQVAHLESEGARFQNKQSDGSATEVQLIASAVQLAR